MLRSRLGYRNPVPNVTTRKAQTKQYSFTGQVNTYKDNDDLDLTELSAAFDARMVKKGRFKTRKGLSAYSVPIGEAIDVQITSTTGASDAAVGGSAAQAQELTIVTGGRATRVDINVKTITGSTGTLLVELCEDNAGSPGTVLDTSSLHPSAISSSYGYVSAYFLQAPAVTAAQDVWVVVRGQGDSGTYNLSTTTSVTTAKTNATGGGEGSAWTAASYGLNVKLYTAPNNPVKGLIRANRPNGLNYTVFAAGTDLYSVNETTGATTSIKSSLSASATTYNFEVIQDAVYVFNGYEQPYKWDFSTVTQDDDAPFLPHIGIEHVGLLFIARTDDSKIAWTNFGDYQTWTSTDFAYMLAPKTPFTITALAKLNGVLYTFAERNKYMLLGEDNQSFTATEASSQRGTFSQKSVVYDDNSIYHADHEGIWQFNGTDETNLAESFLEDYTGILDKSTIVLEKYNNRLYVFYKPNGQALNQECFVINLTTRKLESVDLNTPIAHTYARKDKTGLFLQAHHTIAAVYKAELSSNNYENLGAPLSFELRTAYNHFDAPGQYKRIPKWRPEFASASGSYSVQCGYATEFQTDATWQDFDLSGTGARWDDGWLWDDGTRYATDGNVQANGLLIPGTFRRLQRRYKHVAAHEPVELDSEVLTIEVQRLR